MRENVERLIADIMSLSEEQLAELIKRAAEAGLYLEETEHRE